MKKFTTGRSKKELSDFSLGQTKTEYSESYNPKLLEAFDNKNPKQIAWTTFVCTEFTSLCPKTGQPDFAKIIIDYQPDQLCVESKSLKLYLGSFRMHGEFHESCVNRICNDLVKLLAPVWLTVRGEFTPRGGIPFWPTAEFRKKQSKPNSIYYRDKRDEGDNTLKT